MNPQRLTTYLVVLLAAGLGLFPAVYLVFGSLWSSSPGYPGHLWLGNFAAVAADPSLGAVLYNTVVYAAASSAFAVLIATGLALAVQRTDAPFKRLVTYSLILVFALPWFVEDVAWNYLMANRTGLYNVAISKVVSLFQPGVSALGGSYVNVNSLGGMVWVMSLSLTPLAYLIISPSVALLDSSLEEASLVSGAGLRATLFKVDLPLLAPSILSAALLSVVLAFESFDVAQIIGVPGGVYVLASTVYRYAGAQLIPDDGLAAAYSLIMVGLTVAALVAYSWSVRASRKYVAVGGRGGRPLVHRLGGARPLVGLGFLFLLLVYPVSVLGALVLASVQFPVWNPLALTASMRNYVEFLAYPGVASSMGDTLFVAVTAAAGTLALAASLAYISNRSGGRTGRAAEVFSSLPLAFPTIVLGVGLLWALTASPLPIYGTVWALTLAYTVRYVPVVSRFLSGPMLQVGRELEEASRICGAGVLSTARRILLPIVKPALYSSLVYVLIVTSKDLGAAVMLSTANASLFAAALYNVYAAEPLIAAAGGVVFVALLGVVLAAAALFKVDIFAAFRAEARTAGETSGVSGRPDLGSPPQRARGLALTQGAPVWPSTSTSSRTPPAYSAPTGASA